MVPRSLKWRKHGNFSRIENGQRPPLSAADGRLSACADLAPVAIGRGAGAGLPARFCNCRPGALVLGALVRKRSDYTGQSGRVGWESPHGGADDPGSGDRDCNASQRPAAAGAGGSSGAVGAGAARVYCQPGAGAIRLLRAVGG